jgi:hypothetical protein
MLESSRPLLFEQEVFQVYGISCSFGTAPQVSGLRFG